MRYECESFAEARSGWEARVRLPASAPFFRGHFENAPVLPGVALLVIAKEVLARRVPGFPALAGLSGLRFRRAVAPGERLTLAWSKAVSKAGSRELAFTAHVEEALAADGRWLLAGDLP